MEKIFRELNEEEFKYFHSSLKEGKRTNRHGCFVTLEEPEHYKTTRNFLFEGPDGPIAGFALEGGNLVGVHKNNELAEKAEIDHVIDGIMYTALFNGANKLDCYGEFLTISYMQHGFLPVGKVKFDRDYAPDDWNYEFGEPDVIAMVRAVSSLEDIVKMQENNSFIKFEDIINSIPEFESYDEMLKYRDNILEQFEQKNPSYKDCVEFIEQKENKKG